MINPKYAHKSSDPWYWSRATMSDAKAIGELAYEHYKGEIEDIFTPSATSVEWNISRDIMDQTYNLTKAFVAVARSTVTGKIMAYTWAVREYAWWSPNEMLQIKVAHVDLTLPMRDRIRLVNQEMDLWESFCIYTSIGIICSTTMRHSQDGFLKLHEQRGYSVRGSYAYLKLTL